MSLRKLTTICFIFLEQIAIVQGYGATFQQSGIPFHHIQNQPKQEMTRKSPCKSSMRTCPLRIFHTLKKRTRRSHHVIASTAASSSRTYHPLSIHCQYNAEHERISHPMPSFSIFGATLTCFIPINRSTNGLSLLEQACVDNIETWYTKALSLKCPFFRRRASDMLDGADMLMRSFVIQNQNTELLGPPPSLRGVESEHEEKLLHLSKEELMEVIRQDWRQDTGKGYYVTGRLCTQVYRNDCVFDGPDPDMPVKGLRKYLNAASQLFEQRISRAELESLDWRQDDNVLVAKWRFNGRLRLPWKPRMPEVAGTTYYFTDAATGLIQRHEETWDNMSALRAFFWTMMPERFSPRFGLAVKRHLQEAFLIMSSQ